MLNIARCSSHIINLESNIKKRKDEWNVPAYRCVIEREKVQPSKFEIQVITTRNRIELNFSAFLQIAENATFTRVLVFRG